MAKGDIQVGKDADGVDILAAGTDTHVLTLDSTETLGVKWAVGGGGGSGTVITQQASEPVSPVEDDLWIDTDETAQSGSSVIADRIILRRVATQSVPNATPTIISWDTETSDTLGIVTVPATTITIPSGKSGIWSITSSMTFDAGIGTARAFIQATAGGTAYRQPFGAADDTANVGLVLQLAAADTIDLQVYQQNGSTRTVTGRIEIFRIGALS